MNPCSYDLTLLHLSLIDGIGPVTVDAIVRSCGLQNLYELYHLRHDAIASRCTISLQQAHKVVHGLADKRLLEQEHERCITYGISWMHRYSSGYPPMLNALYAPPSIIYWLGAPLEGNARALAVVGSRVATGYSQRVIDALIPSVVAAGFTIVSGGALGVDSMAHRAALAANGPTVVVMGAGLRHWYPATNKKLFQDVIEKGGSLVSCFPVMSETLPGNFPARNRIIAGLSQATLVVQAAAKSGALITARYALDEGRDVMAVPGPIDDPLSAGCHSLISQGAFLVADRESLLDHLGVPASPAVDKLIEEYVAKEKPISTSHQATTDAIPDQLITFCQESRSIDELIKRYGLSHDELCALLFDLQLAGTLEQDFSGRWRSLR